MPDVNEVLDVTYAELTAFAKSSPAFETGRGHTKDVLAFIKWLKATQAERIAEVEARPSRTLTLEERHGVVEYRA